MAGDVVKTVVVYEDKEEYVVELTNVSDGTGEAAVVKVDKSALVGPNGSAPTILRILSATFCVQGFAYAKLAFDHDADDTALVLSGTGKKCFRKFGGLRDPASTGGTGDIVLTVPAGATTGSYSITLAVGK